MTQPDTSPQNVARVLREAIEELEPYAEGYGWLTTERMSALADALERQAGVTWAERVERGAEHMGADYFAIATTDAILRKSFPEYAPLESESDATD